MSNSGDLVDVVDKDFKFPDIIMTGDERCCFLYDSQTKRQYTELKIITSTQKISSR